MKRKPFWQSRKLNMALTGIIGLLATDPPPFEWATKVGMAGIIMAYIFGEAHEGAANAAPSPMAVGELTVQPPPKGEEPS